MYHIYSPNNACVVGFLLFMYISKDFWRVFLVRVRCGLAVAGRFGAGAVWLWLGAAAGAGAVWLWLGLECMIVFQKLSLCVLCRWLGYCCACLHGVSHVCLHAALHDCLCMLKFQRMIAHKSCIDDSML